MSTLRQAWAILRKDLLIEWRGKARLLSVLLFGVVTLLLFSFALGTNSQALTQGIPGFLVLALLLSSTLALNESFRIEPSFRSTIARPGCSCRWRNERCSSNRCVFSA